MWKQIEILKYHTEFAVGGSCLLIYLIFSGDHNRRAADCNAAVIYAFKIDKTSQECAFAAAGLSENRNYLAFIDGEVNALKNFQFAE
jgi:hypothetical protein